MIECKHGFSRKIFCQECNPLPKLTMIIPTMNRPDFVKRALTFYSRLGVDYKFIVGDGSIDEMAQKTKHICRIFNAEYHNLPDYSVGETIKFLNTFVTTKYCCLLCDDDLILPNAIIRIIDFLDYNNDFTSGNGHGCGFRLNKKGPFGKIVDLDDYKQEGIYSTTSVARVNELINNSFVLLFAVYRTEAWVKMWEHCGQTHEIGINDEIIPNFVSAAFGKTYHVNNLFLIRQYHEQRVMGLRGIDLINSKDFQESRDTFINTLEKYIPRELAIKLIDTYTDIGMRIEKKRIRIPALGFLKIMYLNTKRHTTLPKLRNKTHRDYEHFKLYEEVLKGL